MASKSVRSLSDTKRSSDTDLLHDFSDRSFSNTIASYPSHETDKPKLLVSRSRSLPAIGLAQWASPEPADPMTSPRQRRRSPKLFRGATPLANSISESHPSENINVVGHMLFEQQSAPPQPLHGTGTIATEKLAAELPNLFPRTWNNKRMRRLRLPQYPVSLSVEAQGINITQPTNDDSSREASLAYRYSQSSRPGMASSAMGKYRPPPPPSRRRPRTEPGQVRGSEAESFRKTASNLDDINETEQNELVESHHSSASTSATAAVTDADSQDNFEESSATVSTNSSSLHAVLPPIQLNGVPRGTLSRKSSFKLNYSIIDDVLGSEELATMADKTTEFVRRARHVRKKSPRQVSCDYCFVIQVTEGLRYFGVQDDRGCCVGCGTPLQGNLEDLERFLRLALKQRPDSDPSTCIRDGDDVDDGSVSDPSKLKGARRGSLRTDNKSTHRRGMYDSSDTDTDSSRTASGRPRRLSKHNSSTNDALGPNDDVGGHGARLKNGTAPVAPREPKAVNTAMSFAEYPENASKFVLFVPPRKPIPRPDRKFSKSDFPSTPQALSETMSLMHKPRARPSQATDDAMGVTGLARTATTTSAHALPPLGTGAAKNRKSSASDEFTGDPIVNPFSLDNAAYADNQLLYWMLQYCILTDDRKRRYKKIFMHFDRFRKNKLTPLQFSGALGMANSDLISESQMEYVTGILALVQGCQTKTDEIYDDEADYVKFPMFCAIAALSERILALESTVVKCINKMDMTALKAKLHKARDMFIVNDEDKAGLITLDALRIELHAGRIKKEHEDSAIRMLEQDNLECLNFMDFLVYLPLFIDIHNDILENPISIERLR